MESQKGFTPMSKSLFFALGHRLFLPCEPSGPSGPSGLFGPFSPSGLSVLSRLLSCLDCSLRRSQSCDRHAER